MKVTIGRVHGQTEWRIISGPDVPIGRQSLAYNGFRFAQTDRNYAEVVMLSSNGNHKRLAAKPGQTPDVIPDITWEPKDASGLGISQGWLGITKLSYNRQFSESSLFFSSNESSSVATFDLPNLVSQIGELDFISFPALESLSAPLLKASASFVGQGLPSLSNLSAPSLETVDGDITFVGTLLTEVSFPSLISANVATGGTVAFNSGSLLESFSAPRLATAEAVDLSECPSLNSIDLSVLVSLTQFFNSGGYLNCTDCSSLISLSLPILTTISTGSASASHASLGFNGCVALTDVSIPALVSVNGKVDFFGCALSAASVNHILARLVAAGFTAEVDLSGGTNEAPSGQGITDVETLTGNGATITTN